jgi:indole-3-glycerol phosphate synthase
MTMILNKIVQAKQAEVARKKHERPLATLQVDIDRAERPRNFALALEAEQQIRVIAEIKKASPSKGLLCPNFNPVELAKSYRAGGASAISVLTDEAFFQGDLKFISAIRAEVELPLLRKDFIIDSYQIYESRAAQADAILLIARLLSTAQLSEYLALARELGMEALVEVHDEQDLQKSLVASAIIIGINNRDLSDFHTDLKVTVELAGKVPPNCIIVSESGIKEPSDLIMLRSHGVNAVLVGEALVRALDVRAATARLVCGGN